MAENFYTILTSTGKAKLANSAVLGSKVNFKTLKVGDGKGAYYEPLESQTSLVNEVWSGNISSISIDETNTNWIVAETIIPATVGGFFIREAGIFDEDGDLIAISKLSETYKPIVSEGSIKDLCIKIILEVSNVESVTLKIDPTIIVATRKDIQVLEAKVQDVSAQLSDLMNDRIYYCGTTSGTNTYTATNNKITAYTEGLTVRVKIGTASTGASTLNINGLGAKVILDSLGNAIASGGLRAGLPYQLCYNGTSFIVLGKGGGGNATAAQILKDKTATVDSGPVTGTLDLTNLVTGNIKSGITINGVVGKTSVVDTADATVLAAQMLLGTTAYKNGSKITGTITSKTAQTYTPGTANQSIAAGQYLAEIQTILGDPDLVAANIKTGINIFGVNGSITPLQIATGTTTTFITSGYQKIDISANVSFTPKLVVGNVTDTVGAVHNFMASAFDSYYINHFQNLGSSGAWVIAGTSNLTSFFVLGPSGTGTNSVSATWTAIGW